MLCDSDESESAHLIFALMLMGLGIIFGSTFNAANTGGATLFGKNACSSCTVYRRTMLCSLSVSA